MIFEKLFKNFKLSFPLARYKRVKLFAVSEGAMFIVFAKCSRGYIYSRGYVYTGLKNTWFDAQLNQKILDGL